MAVLKVGIPSAIQGAVFCFANIFVQASVNGFGSSAIAGSTIAMNFEYFTYYVITAFGQTATTFTSQNHSAGQEHRCRKILRICMIFSVLSSLVLIEPFVIFRNFFAGIFSADQIVIQNTCLRILCILFFEPLCNLYEIPAGVLRGTEHSLYPAVASRTQSAGRNVILPNIPCTRLLPPLAGPVVFALHGYARFSDITIS